MIAPTALLFGLVTLFISLEGMMREMAADDWDRRVLRVGVPTDDFNFTLAEQARVKKMEHVVLVGGQAGTPEVCHSEEAPGVRPAPCMPTSSDYLRVWRNQIIVPPDEYSRWESIKDGVMVTLPTAKRHGWRVGQSISAASGTPGKPPVPLTITYIAEPGLANPDALYVHPEYMDQVKGKAVGSQVIWILVDDAHNRPLVQKSIWDAFPDRPKWAFGMEDIKAMLASASAVMITAFRAAGVLAILLVIGIPLTLITLSIDERRRDLATLRAVGCRRTFIVTLIIAESILLVAPAALLGSLVTHLGFAGGVHMLSFVFRVTWGEAGAAALGGLLLAVLLSFGPAVRTAGADVLTALREE